MANLSKARSCDGKHRYSSLLRAVNVARWQSAEHGEPLVAYPCMYCTGYHIGHALHNQGG